jgi:hypothetical protein
MSINYARNSKKKSSDEQFLKASQNWEKCSALDEEGIISFRSKPLNWREKKAVVISQVT